MTTTNTNTQLTNPNGTVEKSVKGFFGQELIQKKFSGLMGARAPAFIASVLQIASNNKLLAKADPISIFNAACVAATLNLPLNNSLGYAYIVPYAGAAQFQLGYKGYIQLAQRSQQFKTISSAAIYEGQLIEENPLTGYVFDFKKKSDKVIGYAAYIELLNGFQKTHYMSIDELQKHAIKYSQTFKKGEGVWRDQFDAMACKTVLKLLLSKYAPLSIDSIQLAIKADSAIVRDEFGNEVSYADNIHEQPDINKEQERIQLMIKDCTTIPELELLETSYPDTDAKLFTDQRELILNKGKGTT